MIEEATVDAYGEAEQASGWCAMIEEKLELPFDVEMLGVRVTVTGVEQREDNSLVALCVRGKQRQAIGLLDLPLPSPLPPGAEWIIAFRCWAGAG